jgi:RimJ/RimL family protein N-acetyltransferase
MPGMNEHGQPIGADLVGWAPPATPTAVTLTGRTVTLEPLEWETHGETLFAGFASAPDSLWTYMSYGPFADVNEFRAMLEMMIADSDWLPFAIVVEGRPLGFASYLRIRPRDGAIEIGSIALSPMLQRSTAATEALYMLMRNAFDLGYRRCEWKCDHLNGPSRSAADRLGFTYEGTFRQATHYKGRNRDTAWYAIIDKEWPASTGRSGDGWNERTSTPTASRNDRCRDG